MHVTEDNGRVRLKHSGTVCKGERAVISVFPGSKGMSLWQSSQSQGALGWERVRRSIKRQGEKRRRWRRADHVLRLQEPKPVQTRPVYS